METLGTAGSMASLAGVVISLLGLGFAILQLRRLCGETRAAREAAEAAERAIRHDLTLTELTRLHDSIQDLKDAHRRGDVTRALSHYPSIMASLSDIRRRHPNLTDELRDRIVEAINRVADMERTVDRQEGSFSPEQAGEFNDALLGLQSNLILELQDRMTGFG